MICNPLSPDFVEKVLAAVPEVVRDIVRANPEAVIAGGVVRDTVAGLEVKDIDVFLPTREDAEAAALLAAPFVRKSTFAYTVQLEKPVQFVYYKTFATPDELISQFDFRACSACVYYRGGRWHGLYVPGFVSDCFMRHLEFTRQPKDAGKLTALRRAINLVGRGWKLDDANLAAILDHWRPAPFALGDPASTDDILCALKPNYGGHR